VKLRQVDVLVWQGQCIAEPVRSIGCECTKWNFSIRKSFEWSYNSDGAS
jgi:hypothetical protein